MATKRVNYIPEVTIGSRFSGLNRFKKPVVLTVTRRTPLYVFCVEEGRTKEEKYGILTDANSSNGWQVDYIYISHGDYAKLELEGWKSRKAIFGDDGTWH